jgi:phospholipase C
MTTRKFGRSAALAAIVLVPALALIVPPARADGDLNNVNHFIIVMQENRSFDNYFGILPFVAGTPYHNAKGGGKRRSCKPDDHTCVDGLSCRLVKGALKCNNVNPGNAGSAVRAFHDPRYCTGPDLDHSWIGSHQEGNYARPNLMLKSSRNRGFVRVNAASDPPDQAIDHDTMGYYDDVDLPFYYGLAVIGQTFPNRAYFLAGTSFGHLTTNEIITSGGYKPITGTIFDRLDAAGVTWTDYYSDLPYSLIFATSAGHTKTVATFLTDAAAGTLPQVSFIDPSAFADQTINGHKFQTDEHPPNDIRAGQYFVSTIVNALRNGPNWSDSVLIITYDEHGGFYDHVPPPAADQNGQDTPDGIPPGQCADNSNPPTSVPGYGASCTHSSSVDAPGLCPTFTPTGPYPAKCATFNQLGFRLPFIAVSPFSKPTYVSHVVSSHTSILALLEKRFSMPPLAARDANAGTLEDMFDFDNAPSLNTPVGTAPLPAEPGDPGCPGRAPARGPGQAHARAVVSSSAGLAPAYPRRVARPRSFAPPRANVRWTRQLTAVLRAG